jgi:hypothetical protein
VAILRQTSFLGGEIDPRLWGRSDLPVYGKGLRTCRNFFVSHQGAAVSRPGTQYLGLAGTTVGMPGRLIPFIDDQQNSMVVLLTANYFFFVSQGALVQSGGVPVKVAHGYGFLHDADMAELQFSQLGDVITFTHRRFPAQELRRLLVDGTSWSWSQVSYARLNPWFMDPGTTVVTVSPMVVVDSGHPAWPNDDATHIAREWQYLVTVVAQDLATGAVFETLGAPVTDYFNGNPLTGTNVSSTLLTNKVAIYADRPVLLRRTTTTAGLSTPAGYNTWRAIAFNFYRGRGGVFGFIGQTKDRDFVDVGDTPNFSIQPPRGTDPFRILNPDGTLAGQDYPAATGFFQQRRSFACGTKRPGTVLYSAVGDYYDFDTNTLPVSGESLDFELASERREEIRSMVAMSRHVLVSRAGVWSLSGQSGSPLDFDSVDARLETPVGGTWLRPLVVDGALLYSPEKGYGVRVLAEAPSRAGFVPGDLSVAAAHLFTGLTTSDVPGWAAQWPPYTGTLIDRKVRGWGFQRDPWGVVWAARNDGQLLALTYDGDQQVVAWSRHDSVNAKFADVCVIPEDNEDAVYFLVQRAVLGGTYVTLERFASRQRIGYFTDDCAVDCCLTYAGPPTKTLTAVVPHLSGRNDVWACGTGLAPYGPLTVASDGTVTLPEVPAANNGTQLFLYVGLRFTPELELLDFAPGQTRLQEKVVQEVAIAVDQSKGLSAGQDFDHLREVQQRTVSGGYAPPLPDTALVVVTAQGVWNRTARAAVRQTLPLPVTVLEVARRVDGGDA